MAYSDTQRVGFMPSSVGGGIDLRPLQQVADEALRFGARVNLRNQEQQQKIDAANTERQAAEDFLSGKKNDIKQIKTAHDLVYSNAYNKFQLTSINTQSQNTLSALAADNQQNPKSFMNGAQAYKKAVLDDDSLAPEVKIAASHMMDSAIGSFYSRIEGVHQASVSAEAAKHGAIYTQDTLSRATDYMRSGDMGNAILQYDSGLRNITTGNWFSTPEAKQAAIDDYKKAGAVNLISQMAINAGKGEDGSDYNVADGLKFINAFKSGNLPKNQAVAVNNLLKGTGLTRNQLGDIMKTGVMKQYQTSQAIASYDHVQQIQKNNEIYNSIFPKLMTGEMSQSAAIAQAQAQGGDANLMVKIATFAPKAYSALHDDTASKLKLDTAVVNGTLTADMISHTQGLSVESHRYYLTKLKSMEDKTLSQALSIAKQQLGAASLVAGSAAQKAAGRSSDKMINYYNKLVAEGKPINVSDLVSHGLKNVNQILGVESAMDNARHVIAHMNNLGQGTLLSITRASVNGVNVNYYNESPDSRLARMISFMKTDDFRSLKQNEKNKFKAAVTELQKSMEISNEAKAELTNG
ncbi:MAG: hypothetical protein PUP46_07900 [Endozoicomonas sp. (ex Botrylloides leachii)]|nr:hypothetical protein [Endozoicomonas sp. (ex Botrylloides leachii)]